MAISLQNGVTATEMIGSIERTFLIIKVLLRAKSLKMTIHRCKCMKVLLVLSLGKIYV